MIDKYGWVCPQCNRVWAPTITHCAPCCLSATHSATPKYEYSEEDYCTCYQDGECWGTKEREATNCGGDSKKCDKYTSDWR